MIDNALSNEFKDNIITTASGCKNVAALSVYQK